MKILFIADKFDDEPRDDVCSFPGGAELTDAAVIEACPWKIDKIKIKNLNESKLENYDYFIIGNIRKATDGQIILISKKKDKYILFEHDMRLCRYDGDFFRAKKEPFHYFVKKCICPHIVLRTLYKNALGTIFLTHLQYSVYKENPFFNLDKVSILGSSAMNNDFFKKINSNIREETKDNNYVVFQSPHRVKGFKESYEYCKKNGIEPFKIKNLKPEEVLSVFKKSKKFVYLPQGYEWAGRMPVEARFLGCKTILNKNVGVAQESWWNLPDDIALMVLKDTPMRFWRIVRGFITNENTD